MSSNIAFYNCGQFHNCSNCVINLDLVYALFYIFFIRGFLDTCMLSHNWSCQTYDTIARTYTLSTCLCIEGAFRCHKKIVSLKSKNAGTLQWVKYEKSNFPYWKQNLCVVYANPYFKVNIGLVSHTIHCNILEIVVSERNNQYVLEYIRFLLLIYMNDVLKYA